MGCTASVAERSLCGLEQTADAPFRPRCSVQCVFLAAGRAAPVPAFAAQQTVWRALQNAEALDVSPVLQRVTDLLREPLRPSDRIQLLLLSRQKASLLRILQILVLFRSASSSAFSSQ